MECATCNATVSDGSKFCTVCGALLPFSCPSCRHENPPRARFCANCGLQLTAAASIETADAVARRNPDSTPHSVAERRQITVLFCDLVGSTALAAEMDPEDLREIIGAYHRAVAHQIDVVGGFVAKYMGDGILIYFGYPHAQEDDAERAVRAGLAIVNAVGQLKTVRRLQTRVGIATGLVVVGELIGAGESQERGIVGETPNLAARLQTLAAPDTVVVAPQTHLLLGNLFEYRDLGEAQIKGFAIPIRAFEVIGAASVESRFEALHATGFAPLVGRDEEIDLLLRRWQKVKGGNGQVVLICGEAGIGKSRLTTEILRRVGDELHTRLRFFCSPQHADTAFYPIINQLERASGFQRDDDVLAKAGKLEALLARASATPEDNRLIADLLSLPEIGHFPPLALSPQQRRLRTIDALVHQLDGLARQQPILQIFEDIHWIDPTSLETMDRTIELIRRLPVLLLMTSRPEFLPPWVGQSHVSMMALGRLDQRDGTALIEGIVGNDKLPADIVSEIMERADGVPLFVEELTKAVIEAGATGMAATSILSKSPARTVPATLHASLMARLDRLGPAKELAQIGATIGRDFTYELLAAISPMDETALRVGVTRLTASGLMLARGTPPESSYIFKHALVQDAAYGTLLRSTRQQLHGRIAEVIETRFPERATREPEVLARHFAEAQQPDRALSYWIKAGKQAAERSGNLEAIRHLTRALETLKSLPDSGERDRQELAIQSAIGTPLIAVHGYAAPETGVAFNRARVLCERLGDANSLFATLSGQWAFHFVRGDQEMMRQLADEARRTGKEMRNESLELAGHRVHGLNSLYFGEFEAARDAFETIIYIYDPSRHRPAPVHYIHDPKFYAIAYLPVIYWVLGYPDKARKWQSAALEYAGELSQAVLATHVRIYGGAGLDELLFKAPEVRSYADAIVELADQHNLRYFRLSGQILKGWAMAQEGIKGDGLELMRCSATERLAIGVSWYQIRYLCMLAATYLQYNRATDGLIAIAEAMDRVERTGEHMWEAELNRIEGELHLLNGSSTSRVEACFRRALEIARSQNARAFELRAATNLARLLRDGGDYQAAEELLVPIYNWFKEGFESPDLVAAKVLLDGLRT
ncbi:MAG: AAA family ATPase [Aestuariivirga sp.]